MATIDKIYGTTMEYDEFYEWCQRRKPEALKSFYPRNDYDNTKNRPITNFPEHIDEWMLENCPIKFVTDRIKEQYGKEKL
jgi:hypothetical protein